jgi:hypothetical protein
LARQHNHNDIRDAVRAARHILVFWAHAENSSAAPILQSGLDAHLRAYPDLIAIADTLVTAYLRVQQPATTPEADWPAELLGRINGRTGHRHTDSTPIEQWVHDRSLIAAAHQGEGSRRS